MSTHEIIAFLWMAVMFIWILWAVVSSWNVQIVKPSPVEMLREFIDEHAFSVLGIIFFWVPLYAFIWSALSVGAIILIHIFAFIGVCIWNSKASEHPNEEWK